MKISILTATYNRDNLLERLYKSIEKNMVDDVEVEWLIMDDGSTDNTRNVINELIGKSTFKILYYKQENQGKMKAINNLMQYVTGDLIIECDSDDFFYNNVFSRIKQDFTKMDEDTYALCYLKYDENECNIGNLFKTSETTMFDLYFKQGEDGEKALVYNAKIRARYEYELVNEERFITEARLHHKLDKNYKIKCVNEPIMICKYQKDGYTKNTNEIFKKYPYGYFEYFKEIFEMDLKGISFKKLLYIIKHYILFATLTNKKLKEIYVNVNGKFNKFLVIILYLPGKILTKLKFK